MTRFAALLCLLALACAGAAARAQDHPPEPIGRRGPEPVAPEAVAQFGDLRDPIVMRGAVDIGAITPVLRAFLATRADLGIRYEQWGSNPLGTETRAGCAGRAPAADLVMSSAADQQVKLVNDGCARAHVSEATARLAPAENWRNELFGITREPAVIIYNRRLVRPEEAPRSRDDLLDLLRPDPTRFAGRVGTYDIEASGLGYLFAFADSQQATTFGSLLEAFGRTGAIATCCSSEITDAVISGRLLIGYNILGSYALARAATNPDLAVVAPQDYTLVLSRAAFIPRQARHPEGAAALLDFLLSDRGRAELTRARLIVRFGAPEEADLDMPDGASSILRLIPLSAALLAADDRQKKRLFTERWRDNLRTE
ncbi:ABC transporter substrate-binding protein [Oceanicella sp. SM1341]|uniref:ABC transporter substrate-binding protein n=1 Tax=Oceanicella sp. SM1341 TaxID=1548889 RepID=UPI000E4D28F1|nr:ABC transporter substrate-binding protein [Oceanicella sp. SM1341]